MVVELVTPAMAAAWLEKNYQHQRDLRWKDVERYAVMMREGRWRLSHQGIAFTDTGKLADGQHRLWAIVEADLPIRMAVTRGMSEEAYQALDQGRARSVSDLAAEEWITARVVGAGRAMARGPGQGHWTLFDDRDPQLLITFIHEHEAALRFACGLRGTNQRQRGVSLLIAAVLGCLARASYHVPKDRMERFAEIVVTGEIGGEAERPVLALRDILMGHGAANSRSRSVIYQKCQRALKAFLEKDAIATLYAIEEDIFPLPGKPLQRESKSGRKDAPYQRRREQKLRAERLARSEGREA